MSQIRRADILHSAESAINGGRADDYGEPSDNYRRIAGLWTAYLDERLSSPLTEADVALMSILVKAARLIVSPDHRDSWVDVAGYAATGYDVVADQQREV